MAGVNGTGGTAAANIPLPELVRNACITIASIAAALAANRKWVAKWLTAPYQDL